MADNFSYDVFISHSSKDKAVVRTIAKRLRKDGLEVWFDEWSIKVGDNIPHMIEEGLESSRVLVLCMSANAFGSDWATVESQAFRFRDPLNKERRFIPLRLDDAPIKGSLAQFLFIDWVQESPDTAHAKLLEACLPPPKPAVEDAPSAPEQSAEWTIKLDTEATIWSYDFSKDRKQALTGADDNTIKLWDLKTGRCLRVLQGHSGWVGSVSWSTDQRQLLSGSNDRTARLWDVQTGRCLLVLDGHTAPVRSVVGSADGFRALSAGWDTNLRLWNLKDGNCLGVLGGHTDVVTCAAWGSSQRLALSSSKDTTLRLWDIETFQSLRVFEGHTDSIRKVLWTTDERRALSASRDKTLRVWDVETGQCLRVLEGHTGAVNTIAWSADYRHAISGSEDQTVRLWDIESGTCLAVLAGHDSEIWSVIWGIDENSALSGDSAAGIHEWNLSNLLLKARTQKSVTPSSPTPDLIQYTNAKVLLVGESGAGKTGLSKVLAGEKWQASDSTVGVWATQWKLPLAKDVSRGDGVEREIWLWDFGGQADQRLIHQLYMDETALAVLVFDGQREDLFETLGQWDRDLNRASRTDFAKLLVAGRVDAGGLRVSRKRVELFARERGFLQFLETSAKANLGCEELRHAIVKGIPWQNIPWRSSPSLFKRLKEEIIRLKDAGRVVMRFNELRETLHLRLSGEMTRFVDEELKAVVGLLAGPGVVWELKFGSWVLLQPERINAYAQAVIYTMRADEFERGCLPEERVLNGDLTYHSSMERLEDDEERFVLLAMHQTLVERGLCVREHTDKGSLLIFPSYYRRERPELAGHPAVLVSYRFNGFLDDIYATLVVRLHHTDSFERDELWRYAADFKTLYGKQLGVKLTRRGEGSGEIEVYFDPTIGVGEKIIFSKYVHEHLLQNADDVERLRFYICPHCKTPVGNREVAMRRLNEWLATNPSQIANAVATDPEPKDKDRPTIVCSECEQRVPLWDDIEQHFASPEIKQKVLELERQSRIELANESEERALVGDVISTVVLSGQISREKSKNDLAIDMEIEFTYDDGRPSGQLLLLLIKADNYYTRRRESDGTDIFSVKDMRHVAFWMEQPFPVFLVLRTSDGEVKWTEVCKSLRPKSEDGTVNTMELAFAGERLDVMSVRRWRDKMLAPSSHLTV